MHGEPEGIGRVMAQMTEGMVARHMRGHRRGHERSSRLRQGRRFQLERSPERNERKSAGQVRARAPQKARTSASAVQMLMTMMPIERRSRARLPERRKGGAGQ